MGINFCCFLDENQHFATFAVAKMHGLIRIRQSGGQRHLGRAVWGVYPSGPSGHLPLGKGSLGWRADHKGAFVGDGACDVPNLPLPLGEVAERSEVGEGKNAVSLPPSRLAPCHLPRQREVFSALRRFPHQRELFLAARGSQGGLGWPYAVTPPGGTKGFARV